MATRPIKLQDADAMDDIASHASPTSTPAAATAAEEPRTVPVTAGGTPLSPTPATPPVVKVSKPAVPPNRDADMKALLDEARKYGKADGEGKRSHVRFARTLVRGGASQVLSPSPKAQSASQMYGAFTESSANAADGMTNSEKASQQAQLSKVRAFIRLGHKYQDEAEKIFDLALDVHKRIMASPDNERVKLRSTYAAICSVAVAQCRPERQLVPLTEKEIRDDVLLNPITDEKVTTGVTLLLQALNLSESAKRGKAATDKTSGRDGVQHPTLDNIIEAFRVLLTEIGAAELAARDAEIEAMRQKKIAAAEKRAKAEAEKEAKAKEAAIQAQLVGEDGDEDDEEDVEDNEDESEAE
jgi:hypothetical protein